VSKIADADTKGDGCGASPGVDIAFISRKSTRFTVVSDEDYSERFCIYLGKGVKW